MESVTNLKNIKITPKKLRFFVPLVKKMHPMDAIEVLSHTPNKPAKILSKAVKSAIANAMQTLKVKEDLLRFKTFSIDGGQKLKRYNPGSRGNAQPYIKRFSHINIVLQAAQKSIVSKLRKKS
ncbi:50S ribosomal protein L22 [Candidatus Roizmanbacteria bacterium]|nr:50S ribosomal protein L22 [Candidatus Roizmanbacteria bacterium]